MTTTQEQVCTGQGGDHAKTMAPGQRRARIPVKDFPDLSLDVCEAPEGWPCFGVFAWTEPGQPTLSFHMLNAQLFAHTHKATNPYLSNDRFVMVDGSIVDLQGTPPDLPYPKIISGRSPDHPGSPLNTVFANIDHGTPLRLVQRLIDGWNAVTAPRGPVKIGGRNKGQYTGLSEERKIALLTEIHDLHDKGWGNGKIAEYFAKIYPRDAYEHKWNRETVRRWRRDNPRHTLPQK